MTKIKPHWVKYKNMGGPRYLGRKEGGKRMHVYNPPKPWGVWSQIIGVVARSEGTFDTVVMCDETGVTFGFLQWTFKSGRLQKMLQSFKAIPFYDFCDESGRDESLFDAWCEDKDGDQIFKRFSFEIHGGKFVHLPSMKQLNPRNKQQRKAIVDICMGRRTLFGSKEQKLFAKDLCGVFAELGQPPEIHAAQVEYAKMEFKQALDYRRKPLLSVGGTIRHLLPDDVWGSPVPAVFYNLFQNSPGGSFRLFSNSLKEAIRKGIFVQNSIHGYLDINPGCTAEDYLEIIWRRLNRSSYADWGFRSKQYIQSGGKNPPRIKRIKPAIEEFYGIDLPYIK